MEILFVMKHDIDFVDVEVHWNLFHDVYKHLNESEYFLSLMNPFCMLSCYSINENFYYSKKLLHGF
jgi:hypothetical protein